MRIGSGREHLNLCILRDHGLLDQPLPYAGVVADATLHGVVSIKCNALGRNARGMETH